MSKLLGACLLGVTLMVAQPQAFAQQAASDPVYNSADERAAQLAREQAARAAQNAQATVENSAARAAIVGSSADDRNARTAADQAARAAETARANAEAADMREDEADAADRAALGRDVLGAGSTIINRTLEQQQRIQLRQQEALEYQDYWMQERSDQATATDQLRQQLGAEQETMATDRAEQIESNRNIIDMQHESEGTDAQGRQIRGANVEAKGIRDAETDQRKQNRAAEQESITPAMERVQLTTSEKLSDGITNFGKSMTRFPSLFYIMSYTAGIFFMAMSLIKANRTVMDPSRNPVSDAVKYGGAGVFLAALPTTVSVLQNSLGFKQNVMMDLNYAQGLSKASGADGAAAGLDQFMINLVKDVTEPMLSITALFGFIAGVFLLFQGLQRLTKGAQEGPKGPAGLGTIMTFAMGSALIAFVPALETVMNTIFGTNDVMTYPNMSTLGAKIGANADMIGQSQAVFTALLAFLAIIGVISFARGLFMLKDTADGAQNASLMGSMSHMIAGVCCVNFGAFANLLQNTLGLANFGIAFQ